MCACVLIHRKLNMLSFKIRLFTRWFWIAHTNASHTGQLFSAHKPFIWYIRENKFGTISNICLTVILQKPQIMLCLLKGEPGQAPFRRHWSVIHLLVIRKMSVMEYLVLLPFLLPVATLMWRGFETESTYKSSNYFS